MAKLNFNPESVRFLCNEAIKAKKKILFVKDCTIFLRAFAEDTITLYPKGYNNRGLDKTSDKWEEIYHKAKKAVGGDDFVEYINPQDIIDMFAEASKKMKIEKFMINVTKTKFDLGVSGSAK